MPFPPRSTVATFVLITVGALGIGGCGTTQATTHSMVTRAVTGRTLISRRARLPISVEFDAPGGDCSLHIASSAYSEEDLVFLDVAVVLNGEVISNQTLFSNRAMVHRALVGPVIPLHLPRGRHTLELRVGNTSTITDDNDRFDVVLINR